MPVIDLEILEFISFWSVDRYVLQVMLWNDILSTICAAVKFQSHSLMWDITTIHLKDEFRCDDLQKLFSLLCFDLDFVEDKLEEPFALTIEQQVLASMPLEMVLFIFQYVSGHLKSAFIFLFGDHPYADALHPYAL